jgi:ADP-ribosylglycohydrolase/fructose-1,6-bisphosphatase/inositol monophosphatase family enzyme
MELSRALDAAVAAARAAGELLRRDFHRAGGPRGSGDKAEADVEAEQEIRGRLLAAFPSWGYLGEETGREPGRRGAPIWLVDPNDGTRDYLLGRRGSAVSIGLVHEGRPLLGVVDAFAYPDDAGEQFAWAEGCGPLQRNGRPAGSELPAALAAEHVVLTSSNADRDPEGQFACVAPARYRTVPSVAHRLALLASGEAAAVVGLYAPVAWDYAAGHALLRAAGAVLVDEAGHEVGYAADGSSRTRRAFAGRAPVAEALAGRPWERVSLRAAWPEGRPARLERGRAVADATLLSRAQGCLLGQLAGDSLGSLVESRSASEIAARFDTGPRRLADGGTWQTLGGQPTDDSEMALALARCLVAEGRYRPEAALAAYRAWLRSGPFDVGQTTRAALMGYLIGESQANGSLMRASPLGVFCHARGRAAAAELAREDSALTHPHPVCLAAVAAYVVAVAHAVREGDGPSGAYRAARDWAREAQAPAPVQDALAAAETEAPVCDGDNIGWVLIALQNAFHALLTAPSLEEGVVATVRRGGDTDTNAAVAGALLGAVHGRGAVPAQWREMVLSCRPHPLRARRPRPMPYWPVDVLELAERLLIAGTADAASS